MFMEDGMGELSKLPNIGKKMATCIQKVAEKGVIPVLDAGIHLRKSLCCKEIDYRVKPDNDNFRSFSVASILKAPFNLTSHH